MAEVSVFCLSGHRVIVQERQGRQPGEMDLIPRCNCGYVGPAYPDNDRGSAIAAGQSHRANADPLPPMLFTKIARVD